MISDQDRVEIRLTREAEYRLPFTFIEALNEGTLFDRPAHVFRDAARQHRLFHVVNRTTENILGTGVVQLASGGHKSPTGDGRFLARDPTRPPGRAGRAAQAQQ
jgi:hypothetical protein